MLTYTPCYAHHLDNRAFYYLFKPSPNPTFLNITPMGFTPIRMVFTVGSILISYDTVKIDG